MPDKLLHGRFFTLDAFDGATINDQRDTERLTAQLQRVLDAMSDGEWHTLNDLSRRTMAPQASVSARLRDLRKERFGGFTVVRAYLSRGLYQYRLVLP